jgi:hypothetical protein
MPAGNLVQQCQQSIDTCNKAASPTHISSPQSWQEDGCFRVTSLQQKASAVAGRCSQQGPMATQLREKGLVCTLTGHRQRLHSDQVKSQMARQTTAPALATAQYRSHRTLAHPLLLPTTTFHCSTHATRPMTPASLLLFLTPPQSPTTTTPVPPPSTSIAHTPNPTPTPTHQTKQDPTPTHLHWGSPPAPHPPPP